MKLIATLALLFAGANAAAASVDADDITVPVVKSEDAAPVDKRLLMFDDAVGDPGGLGRLKRPHKKHFLMFDDAVGDPFGLGRKKRPHNKRFLMFDDAVGDPAGLGRLKRPPTAVITWTGKVTPEDPEVTLTGTADEIHAQILKLNPQFDAQNTGAQARDEPLQFDSANCAYGSEASRVAIRDIWMKWYNLGKGAQKCVAPPSHRKGNKMGGCIRLGCKDDSAIILCNDTDQGLALDCYDVAEYMSELQFRCHKGDNLQGRILSKDNWSLIATGQKC